uniref:Histidine phosphatase family protein n=1 Tax=Syphacia muris TaxID=451379 RepID=A0A0N5AR39_9BILA
MVKSRSLLNPTVLWLVRHGERIDHVIDDWQLIYTENSSDNPPLSYRGKKQANETGLRFKNVKLDYVFVSPFDRCLQTASRIIKGKRLKMKVEIGFVESLGYCETPPGFSDYELIKKKYANIDNDYIPLRNPLPFDEPRSDDEACRSRVALNLKLILQKYHGRNILIVTHNDVIAAIHDCLCGPGNWKYVGLATVSKFVEQPDGSYLCKLSGDYNHLSDPTNLRI